VLRLAAGMSMEETAQAVGSTSGAVRVTQHRALGRLRKRLLGESGACGLAAAERVGAGSAAATGTEELDIDPDSPQPTTRRYRDPR
jgi:RNA polymerase sigma-70 factor (ECF subfamily)